MRAIRTAAVVLLLFLYSLAWNAAVHLVILRDANQVLVDVGRPIEERSLAAGLLSTLALVLLFVGSWRIRRGRGWRAGLGHGVFFACVAGVLADLNQWILYPIPASLAMNWFLFGLMEFSLAGLLLNWVLPGESPRVQG